MNAQQIRIFAALDRAPEVRSLLEDAVKNSPANDLTSLSQTVLGELGTYVLTSLYENLAAYEEARDQRRADSNYRAGVAKLGTMIRQPFLVALNEVVVRTAAPAGARFGARYAREVEFYPAVGHGPDVAGHLEEYAKAQQADGRPLSRMARRLYGVSGGVFTLGDSYKTLTEAEEVGAQSSERQRALIANLAGKLRAPASHELREVIVPFSA